MRWITGLCVAAICAFALAVSVEAREPNGGPQKASARSQAVTVTGCLTRHETSFRLTRVDGADVPKSRNWRTLYVKKSTVNLDIVDAPAKLALKDHVGRQVKITGALSGDRRITPRSIQRMSPSCS